MLTDNALNMTNPHSEQLKHTYLSSQRKDEKRKKKNTKINEQKNEKLKWKKN